MPEEDAPVGEPLTIVVEDMDPAGGAIALTVESGDGVYVSRSAEDGRFDVRIDWDRGPYDIGVSNGIRGVTLAGLDEGGFAGFEITAGVLTIPIDTSPPEPVESDLLVSALLPLEYTFASHDTLARGGRIEGGYRLLPVAGEPFRIIFGESDASGAFSRWGVISSSGVTANTMLTGDWDADAATGTPFAITAPHQGITDGESYINRAFVRRVIDGAPAEGGAWIGEARVVFSGADATFTGGYVDDPSYDVVTEYRLGGEELPGWGIPTSGIYVDARPEDVDALPGTFLPIIDITSPTLGSTVNVGGTLEFVADADVGVQLAVGPFEDQRRWLIHYAPGTRELRLPRTPIDRTRLINASRSISGHVRLCAAPTAADSPFECERISDSVEYLLGL